MSHLICGERISWPAISSFGRWISWVTLWCYSAKRFSSEHDNAGRAWPLDMNWTPDVSCPICWISVGIQNSLNINLHGRANRLKRKFFIAFPLHTDPGVRNFKSYDSCIKRCIIRSIMSVAAWTVSMTSMNRILVNTQC